VDPVRAQGHRKDQLRGGSLRPPRNGIMGPPQVALANTVPMEMTSAPTVKLCGSQHDNGMGETYEMRICLERT